MNPYAAGLSIFVSLVSALTVIGLPVEVYRFGNGMLWRIPGGLIGVIFLSVTFVPFFHKLRVYSIYRFKYYKIITCVHFTGTSNLYSPVGFSVRILF